MLLYSTAANLTTAHGDRAATPFPLHRDGCLQPLSTQRSVAAAAGTTYNV